ncbi:PIN domain-containing protein [bacterium]|nr:PIN domain-containing protein [bacterium]
MRSLKDCGLATQVVPSNCEVSARYQHSLSVTSSITWHELQYGVRRLPAGKRRSQLELFLLNLAGLPILDYDERAATRHAAASVWLESHGKCMSQCDGQIAAVAEVHGLIVVTRNLADFQHYPGIQLENWFD